MSGPSADDIIKLVENLQDNANKLLQGMKKEETKLDTKLHKTKEDAVFDEDENKQLDLQEKISDLQKRITIMSGICALCSFHNKEKTIAAAEKTLTAVVTNLNSVVNNKQTTHQYSNAVLLSQDERKNPYSPGLFRNGPSCGQFLKDVKNTCELLNLYTKNANEQPEQKQHQGVSMRRP